MKNIGIVVFLVITVLVILPEVSSEPCPFSYTVNITNGHRDRRGNIIHDGVYYRPENYATYQYVMVNITERVAVDSHIRGCLCHLRTCVRHCCSSGKSRDLDGKCVESKQYKLTVNYTANGEDFASKALTQYGVIHQKPCKFLLILDHNEYPDETWFFWKNGSINIMNPEKETLGFDDYCLSNVVFENGTLIDTYAYRCFYEAEPERLHGFFAIGMLFSVPFLIITFLVYALIPELRNLHGKNLMCYVASLTFSFILLSVIKLSSATSALHFHTGLTCNLIGYLFYLSIMLSFFWLNVMGYDIYATIAGKRRDTRKDAEIRRFGKYSLFAFGLSIALTIFAYFMDNIPGIPMDLRPKIGQDSCFLSLQSRLNQFIYFHLPLLFILLSNIAFYVITALHIYRVKKEAAAFRTGDSQIHSANQKDQERFFLYLRLFIIMGASWIMESISWIFKDVTFLFTITDFLNALQGFFIFFLFVWKPKVRALVADKCRQKGLNCF